MFLLDTDHLTLLERGGSAALSIEMRLDQFPITEDGTTIINYEEQIRGWLAKSAKAASPDQLLNAYARLEKHIGTFNDLALIPFDSAAIFQYHTLVKARIRIGTMDLKIAAICLSQNATLLTRNTKDFQRVPGLHFEDWSV